MLRPFEPGDFDDLVPIHADPSFWWYPLRGPMSAEDTERFLGRVMGRYESDGFGVEAVVDRESGRLIGWAGLGVPHFLPQILPAVEVGWRLAAPFRGRGLATEAGAAALEFGFGPAGLERIVSIYEPENVPSGRVMEHLGLHALRSRLRDRERGAGDGDGAAPRRLGVSGRAWVTSTTTRRSRISAVAGTGRSLHADWEIWGPCGGYVAAVALRAAGAESGQARPASFYCHYLSVAAFGPVDVDVDRAARRPNRDGPAGLPHAGGHPRARGHGVVGGRGRGPGAPRRAAAGGPRPRRAPPAAGRRRS